MNQQPIFFPKRTRKNRIGKIGIDTVASIVNEKLGWLFRQNHQEDDFGIDGYLDIVLDDGSVTGQSIAVQIKTGRSFFETQTSSGFVFHGDKKHINYYLNLPHPLVFIICEPETTGCYWESFELEKTEASGNNWKMIIPFANIFGQNSKTDFLCLVGPPQDHSNVLQGHWALMEALQTSERILFVIRKKEIEHLDAQPLINFFKRIIANSTTAIKLQGRVILSISGYDEDPRELWEIPEVRAWMAYAEPLVKYWFFFLAHNGEVMNSLKLLLLCICNIKKISSSSEGQMNEVMFDEIIFLPFIERCFAGLNELTEKFGIDNRNEQISREAIQAMGLPF